MEYYIWIGCSGRSGFNLEYLILVAYIPFIIWLAWDNSKRIKQGKIIHHWLNGSLHILTAITALCFEGWQIAVAVLLVARIVFNTALNIFRGLPIDYVSQKPKSVVDKVEKKLFGNNGWLPLIIYSILLTWVLVQH